MTPENWWRNYADLFWSKTIPEPNSGCLLWCAGCDKDGYGKFQVTIPKNRRPPKQVHIRAHRFSYWLANAHLPGHQLVLHKCNTPTCVEPSHLAVGSQKENIAYMNSSGRKPKGYKKIKSRGENHINVVLTEQQVMIIKRLLAEDSGPTYGKFIRISGELGLVPHLIRNIAYGRTWSWLIVDESTAPKGTK